VGDTMAVTSSTRGIDLRLFKILSQDAGCVKNLTHGTITFNFAACHFVLLLFATCFVWNK